jgi:hypothetical protein
MRKRFSGERGVSVVEAPIVLIVIAFFALGVMAFVQIFIQYQHLTSATRASARYAAKSDYDPTLPNPTWGTRPDSDRVEDFTRKAAPEFPDNETDFPVVVSVCPDPSDDASCTTGINNSAGTPAQYVHVNASTKIGAGPYQLIAGLVNGLGSFFGGGDVIPAQVTIRSEAVAAYE